MYKVGIDWSSTFYDICVLDLKGEKVIEKKIGKNKEGFEVLKVLLEEFSENPKDFAVGIETDKDLIVEFLISLNYTVYSINPFSVLRFKERYDTSGKKDDKFDAFNIGMILVQEQQKFRPIQKLSSSIEELAILVDTRNISVKERTRTILRLKSHLNLYFPSVLDFFNDFSTSVPMNFLKLIRKPEQVFKLTESQFLELLEGIPFMSKNRKEKCRKVLVEKTIQIQNKTSEANAIKTLMLVDQIVTLIQNIKKVEKHIEEKYAQQSSQKIFASLPGAGKNLGPELLSFFGDNRERFSSYQTIQSYAGTAPVTKQSGKNFYHVKKRHSCNKKFRNVLHRFAFCSLKQEPWARLYYDQKKAEGKSHHSIIRSLSNKWVKIIFRMWYDEVLYDSSIFTQKREKYMKAA